MHSATDVLLALLAAVAASVLFGPSLLLTSWLVRHADPSLWNRVSSRARTRGGRVIYVLGLMSGVAYVVLDPDGKVAALRDLALFFALGLLPAFALTWRYRKRGMNLD